LACRPANSAAGLDASAKTVTAHAISATAPRPFAQAGPAKTSSPTPATRVTIANPAASETRGDRRPPAPRTSPEPAAPESETSTVSRRPRSTSEYSTVSDGTSTTAPTATPTMVAISVDRPAAASATVRPGSSHGDCAAAQPAMTAATASAADARAGPNRPTNTSTIVTTPASALTRTSASPRPLVSPCQSGRAETRITSSPARASAPATTPEARARMRKS
jgi:hypothetical protein